MRPQKNEFALLLPLDTRWADNDQYGHLNNAVYYQLFDTAINKFLLSQNLLDLQNGDDIFVVAETGCRFFQEIAYPEQVLIGLAISHLGNSSLRYALGCFTEHSELAYAAGFFVHVNIHKHTREPKQIDAWRREILQPLIRSTDLEQDS